MIRSISRKFFFALNRGKVLINNTKVKIHPDLIAYFNVRRNNPTEPKLHWFFNKLLQNGDVFVDVGANAGFISLLASERVGKEGKVIAVEPNPRIAYFTHYTLANNARNKNHILLQVALSDQSCLLPISMSSSDSILMERASIVYKEKASEEVEVLCSTLDIILPTDLKPTVVKIDVEGAELQVLRGAVSVLRKYRPVVSVEVHGLYFDDPYAHAKSLFDYFGSLDYVIINLMKAKVETLEEFMKDSGISDLDPVTGEALNKKGYGNLLLVPDKAMVSSIISLME